MAIMAPSEGYFGLLSVFFYNMGVLDGVII